jgi:hypothetical protein
MVLLASVVSAGAQNFSQNYSSAAGGFFSPLSPTALAPNAATDYVNLGRSSPNGPETAITTGLWLPLSTFASSSQVQQSMLQLQQTFIQAQRGVAAVAAMANSSMPSAPGRTSWALNGSAFLSEIGGGVSFAHRLNTSTPLAITGAYGNGGGSAHIGRVGLMGEF